MKRLRKSSHFKISFNKEPNNWSGDNHSIIVAQFSHVYNRTNNRLNEIREHHLDGGLRVGEQYTFDSLYRLTNFQVGTFTAGGVLNTPSGSQQWQLDGVGNWSIFTDNGTPKTQTINSVNEYTAFAGTANAFDSNKDLKDDGTLLYAFDFLNRLREVRRKSDNALVATYLYDSNGSAHLMGAGRRIKKITTAFANIGAGVVYFAYDGVMTIEERDGMDAVLRQYVNGQRIDEHLSMDTYTAGSISATHYYHENALGNVIALSDSLGLIVERYTYEAYGKPEFRSPLNVQLPLVQSALGNPFLFNGQRYDPETNFSYYRHRYLNHAQGRFVNRDPLGLMNLLTHFAYIANNPLNGLDFLGLQEESVDLVGGPFGASDKNCLEYRYYIQLRNGNTISGSNLVPRNGKIDVVLILDQGTGVMTLDNNTISRATRSCVKRPEPPKPAIPPPTLSEPPSGGVPPVPQEPVPEEPKPPKIRGVEKPSSPCVAQAIGMIKTCRLFGYEGGRLLSKGECCSCAGAVSEFLRICALATPAMQYEATLWVSDYCKDDTAGADVFKGIYGSQLWEILTPGD